MLSQAAHQVLRHDVGRQDEQDDEVGHCQSRQVAVGGPEMPGRRSYNDQGSGLGHDDFVDPREECFVLLGQFPSGMRLLSGGSTDHRIQGLSLDH